MPATGPSLVDPTAEHASELLVCKGERVPEAAEHVRTCCVDERNTGKVQNARWAVLVIP
jgi:hypothetical protein